MASDNSVKMVSPLEIGLCVADLDCALEFYEKGLGFRFISRIETKERNAMESGFCHSAYVVVRLECPTGERIKLFSPTKPPLMKERRDHPPLAAVGFAYITLIVRDLPACISELAHRSIYPRPPGIYTLRPGVNVALVDDPDGNVVEFASYADLSSYRNDLCALPQSRAGNTPE